MAAKATGYYRPEDIDIDTHALAAGNVRFCGNNTGRDSARYFGETICFTDGTLAASASGSGTPEVTLLVQGTPEFNMPDNIAYQSRRGNWIVHEDGSTGAAFANRNNDLWSCLDDGQDSNTMADGCIRIGTLNDFGAEIAAQQRPTSLNLFGTPSGPAAWHALPSWYAVSAHDRAIDPVLQRFMAQRAGSTTVEFAAASHVGGLTHYKARFVKLIEKASGAAN